MFARVIVDIASSQVDKIFDYECCDGVEKGKRVLVPFGGRSIEGLVIELSETTDIPLNKIKKIIKPLDDEVVISDEGLQIAQFMLKKYHIGWADALRLFLPSELRKGNVQTLYEYFVRLKDENSAKIYLGTLRTNAVKLRGIIEYLLEKGSETQTKLNAMFTNNALSTLVEKDIVIKNKVVKERTPYKNLELETPKEIQLTSDQENVVSKIETQKSRTFLLHGVTGSGKTEVYMNVIKRVLDSGKTALMLVPEISLTPQVMMNFRMRFGEGVAVLHSGLSAGERFDEWKRILAGRANIVVGARSAIFAPLKNLGIIVIDEEHDGSYISDNHPRYNTLEIAEKRKSLNQDCVLVLGSATPSLDSYHKAVTGEYYLLELKKRINLKQMPPIKIVDMTNELLSGNNDIFSGYMKMALTSCIEGGNQAIIFINRRGFASFLMCKDCGWVAKCPSCDVSLVYHRDENALKCHYCNGRYHVIEQCPECGSKFIKQGAVGTQRVVTELQKLFPDVKILRMDNDTTTTKDSHLKILTEFREKKAQILVGTQMIAKGHDFPNVTLVGIIDADVSLHQSSYKATEKTFALITQVAGRAGRADKSGEVVLQSYTPRHYVYRMSKEYDYLNFYKKEINIREVTKFPPFSKIIRILITSESEEVAKNFVMMYYNKVKELESREGSAFLYVGAMKSPVKKISDKYRYQVIVRLNLDRSEEIIDCLFKYLDEQKNPKVTSFIEINPQNMS